MTPTGRNGFTFFEILVALSIVAIVLVAVYRLQAQTIQMNIRSRFDTVAPFLAQQKIEEIAAELDKKISDRGDFGEEFQGYFWESAVSEVTSELLGQVADDMRLIHVKVFFHDQNNSYELKTYRTLHAN